MYRLRMVVLLTLVSLTSGLITGRPFFYHLAYLFVALMLFTFLWAWTGISWVHLRRQTRARRAQVGRPLEERFAVRNSNEPMANGMPGLSRLFLLHICRVRI